LENKVQSERRQTHLNRIQVNELPSMLNPTFRNFWIFSQVERMAGLNINQHMAARFVTLRAGLVEWRKTLCPVRYGAHQSTPKDDG
jgi:hypothetical protein